MKTIFITGASSGIGKACVDLFAEKGWNVVATMRKPIVDHREHVLILPLDVTDKKSISVAVKKAEDHCGSIDVLLNNAGYGQLGAIESISDKQMREIFETNIFGLVNVTSVVLPKMRDRNKGIIINVSSVVGKITSPLSGYYCATKHALESISESLWHELSITNIKVKIIEPGFTKTNFHSSRMVRGEITIPLYEKKIEQKGMHVEQFKHPDTSAQVARTIYKAATDGGKKLRYATSNRAKFHLFVRKILPDRIFLYLINKRYKK